MIPCNSPKRPMSDCFADPSALAASFPPSDTGQHRHDSHPLPDPESPVHVHLQNLIHHILSQEATVSITLLGKLWVAPSSFDRRGATAAALRCIPKEQLSTRAENAVGHRVENNMRS